MAKVSLKNILFSSWFLYFIVFVVFFNLVGHALNENYVITLVFILIAFVTSFFTKNMVVILTLGISFANILFYGASPIRELEGFESKKSGDGGADGPAPYVDEDDATEPKKGGDMKDFSLDSSKSTGGGSVQTKMDEINELKKKVQDLRNGLPKNADGIKMKPEEAAFLKDKYQDLLKLQDDILGNIGGLEKSMKHVTSIVDDVKKNIDGVKENMANR
jgi:hypothetical protein